MIREITPSNGLRILIAARLFIEHRDTYALFGLWPAESDPFSNQPDNALAFEDTTPFEYKLGGVSFVGGAEQSTGTLLEPDHIFFDAAILIHGLGAIEFLVLHPDKSWRSSIIENHVPEVAMHPSFSVQRTAAFGWLDIRSFTIIEEPY